MNTTQWPQELGFMKPMEDLTMASSSTAAAATTTTTNNNNNNNNSGGPTAEEAQSMERRSNTVKAQHNNNSNSNSNINNIKDHHHHHHHHHQALNCPRCNSTNTKFCYYNNYSLTQPRYFCKTCRRYWTEGGSLRNVPVGGGSRKNKKSSTSTSTSTSTSAPTRQNPNLSFTDLGGTPGRPPYFPGPMSAMMPLPPPPPEFLSTATTAMGFMFPFEGVRRSSISDSNGGDPAPDHHLLPPPLGFWNGMMGGSTSGGSTW